MGVSYAKYRYGIQAKRGAGFGGGVSLASLMRDDIDNGDGMNLLFPLEQALITDSGTPANAYFASVEDLLTITSAAKYVTGPDGLLRQSSAGGLAVEHDVSTLESNASSVSVGLGKRTWSTVSGDWRRGTAEWATSTSYSIGDRRYNSDGRSYTCISAHTSSASDEPGEGANWSDYWKRDEHYIRASVQSDVDGTYMVGRVDQQVGTTLVVDILKAEGSGSSSSWYLIQPLGVRKEGAATNLITYSDDITDASWSKTRVSAALNAVGPDGQANSAATLTSASGGGTSNSDIVHSVTVSSGVKHTLTFTAKAGTMTHCMLFTTLAGNTGQYFNIENGAVGSVSFGSPLSATIKELANGFFRCSMSFTTTTTSGDVRIYLADGEDFSAVPQDGTATIVVFRAKLEEGAFPTSDIVTTGSQVTRAADQWTISSSRMLYDSTAMSFAMAGWMDYADNDDATELTFLEWTEASTDRIVWWLGTTALFDNSVRFFQRDDVSGSDIVESATGTFSPGLGVPFSLAARHGSTFINGAVGGVALTEDTTPTALPDLSSTDFEIAPGANMIIEQLRMIPSDWGDAGIERVSA